MDLIGPLSSGEVLSCLDTASDADSRMIVSGRVVAVYVNPIIDCLSNPALLITTKAPVETILSLASVQAAGWYYPANIMHLNTTGAVIANTHSIGIAVHDRINVAVSSANYGDRVEVYLLVE
jgi:hypothetical protein